MIWWVTFNKKTTCRISYKNTSLMKWFGRLKSLSYFGVNRPNLEPYNVPIVHESTC
jgi:hypothetical protein